jgi:hypothetical protein
MHRAHLIRLAAGLTGAVVFAQAALAAGEPKNQRPFTKQTARTASAAAQVAGVDVRGEPKNQLPFTRRMAR